MSDQRKFRYLLNRRTKEVHDLEEEVPDCQIDEIQSYEVTNEWGKATKWIKDGDGCKHCLPQFHKK